MGDWVDAQPALAGPANRGGSMIYTSGTTGVPKGVTRASRCEPGAARNHGASERHHLWARDPMPTSVVLMNGPMYHSATYSYAMLALRHRCNIVLQPRFDAEDLLHLIERHRVTHMHMVPTMFVRLLRLPEATRRRYDLSSLRFVVHGAAPCPPDIKRR